MRFLEYHSLKLSFCLVVTGFAYVLTSCKSHPSEERNEAADKQSAASLIAQADRLYAQRQDLTHIGEAVIQARQAHTLDPGNYDAAWRLAKFDYYLATHRTDNEERDMAFREGIDAGEAAVKL